MSLDWNYGEGWQDEFFHAYGVTPDAERIAYYRAAWDGGLRKLEVMSEPTVFERIVAGEIPSTKVFENERVLGIRDIAPRAPVHLLVFPEDGAVRQRRRTRGG